MLLSAEHISLNFGLKQLLDDVTLYLNEGDKIGIIGINGTGKSSFLRVLAGQQVPDSGTVSRDPNVQVCFLSQNPKMDPEATVLEQVFSDFSPDTRALMEYEAKAMLTRLGITDFAQSELGDLVYVNLPEPGDEVLAGETACDVESVKAVSDVMSPVTGVIAEVNEELDDSPELLNSDPYEAWIMKIERITDFSELLSAEEYEAFTKEEH